MQLVLRGDDTRADLARRRDERCGSLVAAGLDPQNQCHFAETKWLEAVNFDTSVAVSPDRPRQAGAVLMVTADVHEQTSRVPEILRGLGVQVEIRSLSRGDYIVGPQSLVERKTVADLHGSIASGRFWQQIGKIRTVRW